MFLCSGDASARSDLSPLCLSVCFHLHAFVRHRLSSPKQIQWIWIKCESAAWICLDLLEFRPHFFHRFFTTHVDIAPVHFCVSTPSFQVKCYVSISHRFNECYIHRVSHPPSFDPCNCTQCWIRITILHGSAYQKTVILIQARYYIVARMGGMHCMSENLKATGLLENLSQRWISKKLGLRM